MKSEQLRFWEKVRIGWPNDCWLWQAGTNCGGYGTFKLDGKTVLAHRFALLYKHNLLNDERLALHSCDVPLCCNPRHLRLGTQAENVADMHERGRQAPQQGGGNGRAILTDDKVREILRLLKSGTRQGDIAAAFSVDRRTVSAINTGKIWRHVK